MTADRSIETHSLQWRGVGLEITFERNWLGMERAHQFVTAHLTVTAKTPGRAPLPITETGYRSHFVHPDDVAEAGGPVAYVTEWLNYEAESAGWKAHEQVRRQLSLF